MEVCSILSLFCLPYMYWVVASPSTKKNREEVVFSCSNLHSKNIFQFVSQGHNYRYSGTNVKLDKEVHIFYIEVFSQNNFVLRLKFGHD